MRYLKQFHERAHRAEDERRVICLSDIYEEIDDRENDS